MTQAKSNYLKAGIWYVIGNILIKGVSFIALPIFTKLLSPDDFGKYNIFMSYESILSIVLGLGFAGTIKIAFFDFKEKFLDYFSSIISLTFIFTVLFDILSILGFILFLRPILPEIWTFGLVQLLIFGSLGTALYSLISTKYVIHAEYKSNLAISAVYTIVNVALSVFLCYFIFTDERYLARIVGYTLPIMLIAYGISLYYVFRSGVIININYWKYALKLGSPLIIHSLAMVLLMQIGKIMINMLCGDSETGIFSVGVTIASILGIILGSFDNAWAPWFYRGLNDGKYKELIIGNNKISLVFSILCSCFILLSPEMIFLMTTRDYYDGLYSLIPMVVATYINFMYLFAVNQEYYYKKTKTIAIGTIIASITCIILNYLLIPMFGYITAAYVSCAGNMVLFVIHTGIVKYWGKPDVVSIKYLFFLLLITSLTGVYTIFFRAFLLPRIAALLVLSGVLAYNALKLYKQIKYNRSK